MCGVANLWDIEGEWSEAGSARRASNLGIVSWSSGSCQERVGTHQDDGLRPVDTGAVRLVSVWDLEGHGCYGMCIANVYVSSSAWSGGQQFGTPGDSKVSLIFSHSLRISLHRHS